MENAPGRKRELSTEEVQDAQIGLLEWELEEREKRYGIESLTGLKRREVLESALEQLLKTGERRKVGDSLILIDLDNFKQVNDTLGHKRGDEVLKRIANLLNGPTRSTDMLARYGGDEFMVLLPNTSEGDALGVAEKLRAILDADEELQKLKVTASLGVCSSAVSKATDIATFIHHADMAMYDAKHGGKNHVAAYKGD